MTATTPRPQDGAGLARAQLARIPWAALAPDGESSEPVRDDLTTMLFSAESVAVVEAYRRIENPVTAQGDLSECAPAVVSVIMAALAEDSVHSPDVGPVLDLLGLILVGHTARWERARGVHGLRHACHAEAMKGYWPLKKIALSRDDPYNVAGLAGELVEMLDEEAAAPEPDC